MTFGMCTDPGRVRANNEDACLALPDRGLFVVADGVGGQEGGEIASNTVVAILAREFQTQDGGRLEADTALLIKAATSADEEIREANRRNGRHMATTLTAAVVRGTQVSFVHAGDSKALVIEETGARQLTDDHTVVAGLVRQGSLTPEEAASHPQRHVITKALGSDEPLEPDTFTTSLPAGSTLLLCSDGLTDFLSPGEIAQVIQRTPDPQEAAERLVAAANRKGGKDNITTILVKVPGSERRATKKGLHLAAVFLFIIALASVAAYGGHWFWNRQFYLAEKDGRLAMYRGLQGSLAGVPLSRIELVTLLPFEAVNPPYDKRIRDGMSVSGIEDARAQLHGLVRREDSRPMLAYASGGQVITAPVQLDGTVPQDSTPTNVCTYEENVTGICWSPEGTLLAFGSGGKIYLVPARKSAKPIEVAQGERPIQITTDLGLVCRESQAGRLFRVDLVNRQRQPVQSIVQQNPSLQSPGLHKITFRRTGEPVVSDDLVLPVPLAPLIRPIIARYPPRSRAQLEIWVTSGIATGDGRHVLLLRSDLKKNSSYDLIAVDPTGKNITIVTRSVDGVFALYRPGEPG